MYVCVCAHMYVCVCAHMYVCVCAHMYVCVCAHKYCKIRDTNVDLCISLSSWPKREACHTHVRYTAILNLIFQKFVRTHGALSREHI